MGSSRMLCPELVLPFASVPLLCIVIPLLALVGQANGDHDRTLAGNGKQGPNIFVEFSCQRALFGAFVYLPSLHTQSLAIPGDDSLFAVLGGEQHHVSGATARGWVERAAFEHGLVAEVRQVGPAEGAAANHGVAKLQIAKVVVETGAASEHGAVGTTTSQGWIGWRLKAAVDAVVVWIDAQVDGAVSAGLEK